MSTKLAKDIEARINDILVGAIDPHVHSGPSIAARAIDHFELAQLMSTARFAAVITKDHDYSGVIAATMIGSHHPELITKVYSSIVLNNVVGGFNPYAVEHAAAMGGKTVYMPTLAAENHLRWEKNGTWAHPASTQKMRPASAIRVLDQSGQVLDEVKEVLEIIAKNDMALASGHLHISETWKIFEEAKMRGVKRLILTHPEEIVDASLNDVKGIASMGAFVEHSLCMFLEGSKFKVAGPDDMRKLINAAGVSQTIMGSDLGQPGVFNPLEGFRLGVKMCLELGFTDDEVHQMVSTNTARAFGLEAEVVRVKALPH
jgi:hypothetical protein